MIWSATNHPDKLFPLWNIDADEELYPPVPPPEPEPVVIVEKVKKFDEDGNEIEEEEEEAPEEEVPKKKTKPEPVRPVGPKLQGNPPVPSEHDRMIEI